MVKQCGQESSPEDAVIDAALETCLAERANNLILPMLQCLSTEENSLSGTKMKSAVWSAFPYQVQLDWYVPLSRWGRYRDGLGPTPGYTLSQEDSRQIPSDVGDNLKFLVSIMVFLNVQ